jgi:hypothetical protein
MKIEMLEKVLHGRDVFEAGDVRTVPDDLGAYFCSCGWAKDSDGNVETAARDTHAQRVVPDSVVHGVTSGEVK